MQNIEIRYINIENYLRNIMKKTALNTLRLRVSARGIFISIIMLVLVLLSQNQAMAAQISVTWNPVEGCNYTLHYGNASRAYTKTVEATETGCAINLPPGVYYFAVTAHWKDCQHTLCTSEFSNEVSLMLSDAPEIVTLAFSPGK
jgi:hypothetical protein